MFEFIHDLDDDDEYIYEEMEFLIKKLSHCEYIHNETKTRVITEICKSIVDKKHPLKFSEKKDIILSKVSNDNNSNDNKQDNENSTNNNSDHTENDTNSDNGTIKEKIISPKELLSNKIFKKIAIKYHPDKSTEIKAHKIFSSANDANKKNEISKLIFISKKCKINLSFTEEEKEIINSEMKILRDQISTVQNSVFFKWDKYDDKTRDSFVKQLKVANNIK
jgi:hypothetical protein